MRLRLHHLALDEAGGVNAAPYVLIPKAAELTGYTVKAIRCKISEGVWRDGIECRKAPDGHWMINLEGVKRWVESAQA